jgi:hypothetical protein
LINAENAKNKICEQIDLIDKGKFNLTNPITPVHTNPLIQKALQESKKDLNENEVLFSILENVNYLTNATTRMQREISSLKEYRNDKVKQEVDSINQELHMLYPILNMLKSEAETLEKTHPPGEGWMSCEANARASTFEKMIEFFQNLKTQS